MAENNKKLQMPQGEEVYMSDQIRLGVYSNVANVSITDNEVSILFMQKDATGVVAVSKVILPIRHAQSLVKVLSTALQELEKQIGKKK